MKKMFRAVPLLMAAALLMAGCGSTPAAADGGVPDEAAMSAVTTRLMPEAQNISQMEYGNLESDYADIIGSVEAFGTQIGYARVTDATYRSWAALTDYYKSVLTEKYMGAHYMEAYLLSAEEAKTAAQPPMYLEFDGALGRNTQADGAGIVEYATNTAVFSDVTENSFTASMDSMDGYGSKVASVATFVMGSDGVWRIDSIENQWSE